MPEPTLRHMDLEEHLNDPARKQQYVTTMFDIIAPKYDWFTRIYSLGMDQPWKKELLAHVADKVPADGSALDLASGTGDIAFAVGTLLTRGKVLGIDVSPEMVRIAQSRQQKGGVPNVRFQVGDMMKLDLPDASMDVVSIGYGLRNVPDFRGALREIARVMKPGAILANLDFARPRNFLWRFTYLTYLSITGNFVGWWVHGEAAVYGYISRSIAKFVSWQDLAKAMEESGLEVLATRPKLLGGVCLHVARKKG